MASDSAAAARPWCRNDIQLLPTTTPSPWEEAATTAPACGLLSAQETTVDLDETLAVRDGLLEPRSDGVNNVEGERRVSIAAAGSSAKEGRNHARIVRAQITGASAAPVWSGL